MLSLPSIDGIQNVISWIMKVTSMDREGLVDYFGM